MSDPKHIADFDEFTRLAQLAEIETLRATLSTQAQRIVELEVALTGIAVVDEHDYPGDAPELVGHAWPVAALEPPSPPPPPPRRNAPC